MQEFEENGGFRNVVMIRFTYSCISPGTVRPDPGDLYI